jgi:hypothetical protein
MVRAGQAERYPAPAAAIRIGQLTRTVRGISNET